jgi:hypothetical protein
LTEFRDFLGLPQDGSAVSEREWSRRSACTATIRLPGFE